MPSTDNFSLIPDFFYDVLLRLIPGTLLLSLYFFDALKQSLNIQTITIALMIAYVLGYTMNILSGTLWNWLLFKHRRWINFILQGRTHYDYPDIWKITIHELPGMDRILVTKSIGEHLLYKSLTLIPLVCLFYKPGILITLSPLSYWGGLATLFVLFTFCMLSTYRWLCGSMDRYKAYPPSRAEK